MIELNDNAVMLQVKAGDLDQMAVLFDKHHRALFNFAFHMTHDREASEDMVQATFYRMIKYRHSFKGNGEFVVWMFYVGRNVLRDQYKKQKKYVVVNEDNLNEIPLIHKGSDAMLEEKQNKERLYKAIEQLNIEDREVLVMHKFQELQHGEIAEILGIKEGAVKVRVHRAFNKLKTIYLKNAES